MQCIEGHEQMRPALNTETPFTEKKQGHYLFTITKDDRRSPPAPLSLEGGESGTKLWERRVLLVSTVINYKAVETQVGTHPGT